MHIKDPTLPFWREKSNKENAKKRGCCVAECRTKEFLIYHAFRYSRTKDAKYVFFQFIPKVLADRAHISWINCGIFLVFLMAFSALILSVCLPSPWFCINQQFFPIHILKKWIGWNNKFNNLKSRHHAFVVRVDIDWRHANSTQREGESSMFYVRF